MPNRSSAADEAAPQDNGGAANAVRTLARGLEVLRLFTVPGVELNQTDIAAATGLPAPTVHRLVGTLVSYEFLEPVQRGRQYRLGPQAQRMSAAALWRMSSPQNVHERLRQVCESVGETVNLAILVGTEVIYLDSVTGPRLLTPATTIGSRISAHCTAVGKSLLAQLDNDEILARLGTGPYERLTEHTAVNWRQLRPRIERVRKEGLSVSDSEYELGLTSLAVALPRRLDRDPVAVNVALPTVRATERARALISQELTELAANLQY